MGTSTDIYDDDTPGTIVQQRGRQDYSDVDDMLSGPAALAVVPQHGAAQAPAMAAEMQALIQIAAVSPRRPERDLLVAARRVGERLSGYTNNQGNNRALYSYPVGGQRVEGPTVQLAEALAQEWGFLWIGIRVDRMDGDRVYLSGIVIDVKSGSAMVRPHVTTLPPPSGKFTKADQVSRWESMQMQSAISKAIRGAILHALPAWFVEEAVKSAREALSSNALKGVSLRDAGQQSVDAFVNTFSVPEAAIVSKLGAARELWTVTDIVQLRQLFRRLKDGSTTIGAEFDMDPPAAAAPAGMAAAKAPKKGPPTDPPARTEQPPAFNPVSAIEDAEADKGLDKGAAMKARAAAGITGPLDKADPQRLSAYLATLEG